MRRIIGLATVALFLTAFPNNQLRAQIPMAAFTPAVLDDGSWRIGWFLESHFAPYFLACSKNTPMKKGDTTLSSIPISLQTLPDLNLWGWVTTPKGYTAANAFSVVSADGKGLPNNIDPRYQLPLNLVQDPISMLPSGRNRAMYSANCSAILAAALDADAGISFPIAKLSAVVKSDYQNTEQGELGVVEGVFNSPFFQLYYDLNDTGNIVPPGGPEFAHLMLWDWYRQHYASVATVPADKFYALSWFQGLSFYWINKDSRTFDGSVNVSASANYLAIASVSATASDTYKSFAATEIENFAIASLEDASDKPVQQFDQLDSVDQVIQWGKDNLHAQLDNKSFSGILRKGSVNKQSQTIVGASRSLCNHSLWQPVAEAGSTAGTLSIDSETFNSASSSQPVPSCTLSVSYLPADSVFAPGAPVNAAVHYHLSNSFADKTLNVSTAALSFQTTNLPQLSISTVAPYPFSSSPSAGGYVLTWQINAIVQNDPQDPIDVHANITPTGSVSLSNCNSFAGAISFLPATLSIDSTGTLKATLQQFVSTATAPSATAADNVNCAVSGTLHFKTLGGNFMDLQLPTGTLLEYPNAAPTPHHTLMTVDRIKVKLRPIDAK